MNFYESAIVKPWFFFPASWLISFTIRGRSPSRVLRWVPRLAGLGEAGNPAILASFHPPASVSCHRPSRSGGSLVCAGAGGFGACATSSGRH